MNTQRTRRRCFSLVLCLSFATELLAQQTTLNSSGQNCYENVESGYGVPNSEANLGWAQGSAVQVNITGYSTDDPRVAAIQQAFSNWQGVGGVTFQVTVNGPALDPSTPGTFTVSQDPSVQGPVNAIESGGPGPSGHYYSSTVAVNPVAGNTNAGSTLDALTKLLAHEIGHTFGMDDAPDGNSPSAMATHCDLTSPLCGSDGPTAADLSAATCEDFYTQSQCIDPGNSDNPTCQCGTSGDCSGGLACQGGTCGCTNPCDDPYCAGWESSCGTCRDDGDCGGGLVCQGGQCGCSDPCDDSSCPGYDPTNCGDPPPPPPGDPGPGSPPPSDPPPPDPGPGACDYPDDYCDGESGNYGDLAVLRDLISVGGVLLATAVPLIGFRKRRRDEDSK